MSLNYNGTYGTIEDNPQMPDNDELKSCPFCGGEPSFATPLPHDAFPVEYIFCTKCKASAPSEKKWNRRISEKQWRKNELT